jgi:DNA-binding CsgD family transcriptional regulator
MTLHPHLVGRTGEMARLESLATPGLGQERVLLLLGDQGIGKTALLEHTVARARNAGTLVLRVAAAESESRLPFAGLHWLIKPVLPELASLPEREATALGSALGLEPQPAAHDRLLAGIALLSLLGRVSERSPVLLVIDNAHLLDRSSQDILAFAGHRLSSERAAILAGAQGVIPPSGFGHRFPEVRLRPLSRPEAIQLLDRQPRAPAGRARGIVLAQANGNPMALIELAKAIAADPAAGRGWPAEPLPLTDHLTALISSQIQALPPATQSALLLAAVAESIDPATATRMMPGTDVEALAPAEAVDLVRVDRAGVRFAHPLVRSAVYHGAPFARRASAHRRLAAALADQPDRQAWHLAAAALHADDHVADLLEATARQAQRRGGAAAAALALERAAELTSDRDEQARRLISAAALAVPTGQANWVQELATQALSVTSDPGLRLLARQSVGWALAWSSRRAAALSELVAVARQAPDHNPLLAWNALATAGTVAYQSGEPTAVRTVREVLSSLEQSAGDIGEPRAEAEIDASRLWATAATRDYGEPAPDIAIPGPDARSRLGESALSEVGAAAWLLDHSETAMTILQSAVQMLRAPELRGASGATLSALGWACLDAGRWDEALEAATEAGDLGAAYQMAIVSASSSLITGTVLAARGASAEARECIAAALADDPERCRSVAARAHHALGLSALADGDYVVAYGQLRPLFADDGCPLHFHVSYLAIADLATAATRAGRAIEGQDLLARIEQRTGKSTSPRMDQLMYWARAILAVPPGPEAHFAKALAEPAGRQWRFERARLSLDYGGWLRRQRRINEAKGILTPAIEIFRQLHASPWLEKTETELRACGVGLATAAPSAIAALSPQQQQIIRLAAQGHSNREIAERMFLSPRTVSSHLYNCFPKLGVSSRNQLRDLLDQIPQGTPAP